TAPIASASSMGSIASPDEDSFFMLPSYSGPSPRRRRPASATDFLRLFAGRSGRFRARLGAGAAGALARAHTAGSRNSTRAAHAGAAAAGPGGRRRGAGRGRGTAGARAGGNAFVLQALVTLRAHHAEALAARAGSAAAAR